MKRIISFLLFFLYHSVFGAVVEKDNVAIKYEQCPRYKTITLGLPYCVKINNLSGSPISVNPAIIDISIVPYQEVKYALSLEERIWDVFGLSACIVGNICAYQFRENMKCRRDIKDFDSNPLLRRTVDTLIFNTRLSLVGGVSCVGLGIYSLLMGLRLGYTLPQKSLHEIIIIQPGETVEKLVWPKSPHDQFNINFDAIKVLK